MRTLFCLVAVLLVVGLYAQMPTISMQAPPDVAAPPADATRTASGLATQVIKPGTGKEHPSKDEVVTIQFSGWTTDGNLFDSSVMRATPLTLALDKMIPGLREGIQLMSPGEMRRLWVPESLAYKGQKGKPAGTLVFDVVLLDLPTRAPADVKAPPADAQRTASGLSYKVLRPGTGSRHPLRIDEVTVHYSGWRTDGKMFDSSVARGKPLIVAVNQVIPGWTEGLQLMVEGEKARFWIPERLAYQGQFGKPAGMLVFDIELLKIR